MWRLELVSKTGDTGWPVTASWQPNGVLNGFSDCRAEVYLALRGHRIGLRGPAGSEAKACSCLFLAAPREWGEHSENCFPGVSWGPGPGGLLAR